MNTEIINMPLSGWKTIEVIKSLLDRRRFLKLTFFSKRWEGGFEEGGKNREKIDGGRIMVCRGEVGRYPLTKETLERMLALRLITESKSEDVFKLLRFIQKHIDEFGSHDGSENDLKELASPKQMALGKDISNPLIVDSLLKTIWLSVHHVIAIKYWLFQSKRLLFKELQCVWIHPPGVQEAQDEET
nr:hypothetical protein [Tanacetum cinerariifolium]